MDSIQDGELDLDYYARIMEGAKSIDLYLNDSPSTGADFDASFPNIITEENVSRKSTGADFDASFPNIITEENVSRKRDHDEQTVRQGSKAFREKMRRDKMNERFTELSKLLESGKLAKADKYAVLEDAICVLKQLKSKAEELKDANTKLEEEIKTLKEEKHELREEKSLLRAAKEKMEERLKAMSMVPQAPAAYHPFVNKMIAFPSFGTFPVWQWMPPAARDISKDHELRPPMA